METRQTISAILRSAEGLEYRPGQVRAAEAVHKALTEPHHLLLEAGTGTGKTLAYLLAIHLALEDDPDRRFCVATYTRTLQEQILSKDLPLLRRLLGRSDLQAAVAYGSANYLCLLRFAASSALSSEELFPSSHLRTWARTTRTGLFREIALPHSLRREICRDPDSCLRQRCPHYDRCFFYRSRRKLHESDLMVVNHHLLFCHLATGGEALPEFDGLIVDEAHQVEDVATSLFRLEVSLLRTRRLLAKVGGELRKTVEMAEGGVKGLFRRPLKELEKEVQDWFERLRREVRPPPEGTVRLQEGLAVDAAGVVAAAERVELLLQKQELGRKTSEEAAMALRRAREGVARIREGIRTFLERPRPEDIYLVESSSRDHEPDLRVAVVPITVADLIQTGLLDRVGSVVFVSATLSTAGRFDHFRSLVSTCPEAIRELSVPHGFDFRSHVLLYVPEADREFHEDAEAIVEEVERFASVVPGGIFVLFTNHTVLQKAAASARGRLRRPLLVQDSAVPSHALLETFRRSEDAVLFGNQSFWQGVDVPENRLRCVIITRLPFPVPTDPVVEARSAWYTRTTGSGFLNYALPKAVTMLRQGFGRLMRGKDDHGVVAVLDTRLRSRPYGRVFLDSLPDVRMVSDFEEVRRFFRERGVDKHGRGH